MRHLFHLCNEMAENQLEVRGPQVISMFNIEKKTFERSSIGCNDTQARGPFS